MKWLERLVRQIGLAFHDLIGEGETADHDPLLERLEAAEAQLVSLERDCAEATARAKRLEMEWQAGSELLRSLHQQAEAALQAGEDEAARHHQEQARSFAGRVEHLAQQAQAWRQVAGKLQSVLRLQRAQLEELRLRRQSLTEREQGAEMLERLQTWQREMRQAGMLQTRLREQEEQVARRNDRLAAREELSDKF